MLSASHTPEIDVGLRFRRRIRLFPGVRINLSKSGVSTSIGIRGAHVTVGPTGTRTTVGLPGAVGSRFVNVFGVESTAPDPSRTWIFSVSSTTPVGVSDATNTLLSSRSIVTRSGTTMLCARLRVAEEIGRAHV